MIVVDSGLTGPERAAAQHLTDACDAYDRLDTPARLDGAGCWQLRCFAGDELVGLATLQDDADGPEVCVLVAPAHRRRGYGRALLEAARAWCREQGRAELLLVCEAASPAGLAFVAAAGAVARHAEHRLLLDPAAVDRSRPVPPGYALRPAGEHERALLAALQAGAFGDPPEAAAEIIAGGLADSTRQYVIGSLDGVAVGLLRIGRYDTDADITGFGVLPAQRGLGLGRAMLVGAVDMLLAEGWERIVIETFSDNRRALGLYESSGFRVTATYQYFAVSC